MSRKWLVAPLLSLTALVPVSPVEASWGPVLGRQTMLALARCETQNNTAHRTRSYVSAWGFYRRTWDLFADTPASQAWRLSWDQQARVVDRAFWFGHEEHGRFQWAVGPWGHGCFKALWKRDAKLRHTVCHNRKQKVRRWCRP